jgi:potassium/hydrogen antiporter
MTNYIILVLCIIVILSYLFDLAGKYVKIPSVIFLIFLGIGLQYIVKAIKLDIPDLQPMLPVIGTLGLVMIVMEASLDLKLERSLEYQLCHYSFSRRGDLSTYFCSSVFLQLRRSA